MKPSRRAVVLLFALLVVHLGWSAQYIYRTSFIHDGTRVFTLWDDAMISMQYARNLSQGAGLVWNAGEEPVQGFTNLGVTLAMSALHRLGLAATRVSLAVQVLVLALGTASLILVWGLARRLAPDHPLADWIALAAVLASILCAPLQVWSLQGSDVGFVALWLLGSLAILASSARTAPVVFVLAAGLWLRPDTIPFFALLLAAAYRTDGGARTVGWGVAAGMLSLVTQLAIGALYYGDPLPNTYYLKATGTPRELMLASGLGELVAWLPRLLPGLALGLIGVLAKPVRPIALTAAAIVLVAQVYNIWVGGDFITGYASRFVAPSLPVLWVLAALGAGRLCGGWSAARPRLAAVAVIASVAIAALAANPTLGAREWLDPRQPTMHCDNNANNYNFALYLREHTHPSTTLGAHWGGVPVYFSGRRAIDVLGKSDRHIAKLEVDRFFPGHSKWDWDYVLAQKRPDVFRAPSRGLGSHPDFRRDYVKIRTQRGVSFFMRRAALDKLADRNASVVNSASRSSR